MKADDRLLYSPRGRILIVDDDALARTVTRAALAREGHDVDEAEDGTSGLRLASTQGYDLVILDFVMPGLSGQEVLEGLRARWSPIELPVIMATARDSSTDIVRALNTGANDYVVKPFDSEVLIARVRSQMRVKRLAELRTQFVELASHDLRGLLTILRGGAAALKFAVPAGRNMSATAFQLLCNVHDNAVQLQTLLEDFLQIKGIDDAHVVAPDVFDINDVARQVGQLYALYASQKGMHIGFTLDETDPRVHGDPKLLRQVLQNLIDNAVKFGLPGTMITVSTAVDGNLVRVTVSDDGPGIPEAELADLFIKGKPLSNRPTGGEQSSHVGLPLCKYYLQMHESELEVHNNPERGVAFSFTLKWAPPAQ